MELMSSLLLCALAALVPLTLGILPPSAIIMDDHKLLGRIPVAYRPKVILNPNSPVLLTQSEHEILSEPKCKHCIDCMEMAISLNRRDHKHISYSVPDMQEAYANDILESYHQYKTFRKKREMEKYQEKTPIKTRSAINTKRKDKAVTVTKYSRSGQVYALKIKEEDRDGGTEDNGLACRVYRVKKHYPCDVPDKDLMKLFTKKKGKRTKKVQSMKRKKKPSFSSMRTTKSGSSDPKGMKTLGDTSQTIENFMTSLEEMY